MVNEIRSSYPLLSILIFWYIIPYLFILFVYLFYIIFTYCDLFFVKGKHCQKVRLFFGCHFDSVTFLFHFSYNGAITKCMTAIIVLKKKCKEYQQTGDEEQAASSYSFNVMGPPQVPAIGGPITRESSRSSSNETEQEVSIVRK